MPSVAELSDTTRYRLAATIEHENLHAWLKPYLFARSPVIVSYWVLNLGALLLVAYFWRLLRWPFADAFATMSLGMVAGYLLLVPIHEHVHAFAYRITGAPSVYVRYSFRTLSAFCTAPGHVVAARDFVKVCLAPFAVLNPILLLLCLTLPSPAAALAASGALLLHIGACSGDIALLQFLWRHRHDRMFTYDDNQAGKSYFYTAR